MGWMKVTVMTAAPPAMPTCWRRPGAAAAEVAMAMGMGIGRVFPEKAGLVLALLVEVQRLMVYWGWASINRSRDERKCNAFCVV